MYGDGDSDSDTDDDEWVSIFVLCMSVSRQSHSNFVFNASAADIFRCVSSVFYFGLVTTSSCRFFVFMRWFIYFIRLVSLFFFHRLAPLRLDSKADREEMTRTRVNHKLIHKLVALENILLLAVFVEINIFPLSQMHYRSAFCCSFISPRPRIRRTYLSAVVVHVLAIRKS